MAVVVVIVVDAFDVVVGREFIERNKSQTNKERGANKKFDSPLHRPEKRKEEK